MSMNDAKYKAVKMTVTFADGHTEDYNTFIASVATGLIAVGRDEEEGEVVYMADKDGFQSRGIIHIAASAEVIAGLVNTLIDMVASMLKDTEPRAALELLRAFDGMRHSVMESHGGARTKRIDPKSN